MHVGSVTYWFSSEANHVEICLEGHAITGDVRHDLLRYIKKTKDVEIVKLETRYMKSREKRNSSPEEIEKKILPLVSKTHFRNISKLLSGIDGA